jgi:hypothetical protein
LFLRGGFLAEGGEAGGEGVGFAGGDEVGVVFEYWFECWGRLWGGGRGRAKGLPPSGVRGSLAGRTDGRGVFVELFVVVVIGRGWRGVGRRVAVKSCRASLSVWARQRGKGREKRRQRTSNLPLRNSLLKVPIPIIPLRSFIILLHLLHDRL